MSRDLFVQRDAHGKPMKLGRNQDFILSRMGSENRPYPHKGIARSAWLSRILESLEKRGLATSEPDPDSLRVNRTSKQRVYTLTEAGRVEADRVLNRQRRAAFPTGAINKTLRQAGHIQRSVRETMLSGAEKQLRNEGVLAADEHFRADARTVEDSAYERAAIVATELKLVDIEAEDARQQITFITRWLALSYIAGYYARSAEVARKEVH